jgi:hypothetical protein
MTRVNVCRMASGGPLVPKRLAQLAKIDIPHAG